MLIQPPENPLERLIREIESSVSLEANLVGLGLIIGLIAWLLHILF